MIDCHVMYYHAFDTECAITPSTHLLVCFRVCLFLSVVMNIVARGLQPFLIVHKLNGGMPLVKWKFVLGPVWYGPIYSRISSQFFTQRLHKFLMPQVPSHCVPGILHSIGSLCASRVQHPTGPSAKSDPTTHAALCRYLPAPPVAQIPPEFDPDPRHQVNWPCFVCAPLLS